MAVLDPNYRYATQTWEADGVRTQYDIAFDGGYIRQADVAAYSVLSDPTVDVDGNLQYDRRDETLTFISETVDPDTGVKTATVQILPAVETGRRVIIFRDTEKSAPLVKYQNGSILTEANLDLANEQAIFGIAEIVDGLQDVGLQVQNTVNDVVDLSTLINDVYQQVLALIEAGGIVSVTPKTWSWTSDGSIVHLPIPDADLDLSLFYDVYFETSANSGDYTALKPDTDFTITVAGDEFEDSTLNLAVAQANGVRGFAIERGFARPYTGPTPITTIAPRVVVNSSTTLAVDNTYQNALIINTSNSATTITIKKHDVSALAWGDGQSFSVLQQGTGKVSLVIESSAGSLTPSPGFSSQTRGQGSIITATAVTGSTDVWAASGDLLRIASDTSYMTFQIDDRSVLNVTNITTGTAKGNLILPFGLALRPIANAGLYAYLLVAQTAGTLVTVDVLRNGVSILTSKLTIDNSEKSSLTANTPASYVAGGDVLNAGDEISVSITVVGTALAKGLSVRLVGQRTS